VSFSPQVYGSLFAVYSTARVAYFVGPQHVLLCAGYCWANLAFREWFAPGIVQVSPSIS
jgi:hypothetical protein